MIELSNISSHLTPLLKHIHEECDAKRKAVEEQTEAEIKEIQSNADAEKQELWESGIAGLKEQENDIVNSTLKHARLDCDLRVKRKLSQATENLLSVVREKLDAFAESDDFATVFEQLVTETLKTGESLRRSADGPLGVLRVPSKLEPLAQSTVKSLGSEVSVESDPSVKDGVSLTIDGTRYTITNTLSSRLIKRENHIRMAIAQLLNAKLTESS